MKRWRSDMTTEKKQETQEKVDEALKEVKYFIDSKRAQELGRSLDQLLFSRRCDKCRTRLAKQELPSVREQFKDITECCAQDEGFVSPDMPLQEIVFRTLLAEGNKPLTLAQLHYAVTEKWATPIRPMNLSLVSLKRILDRDTYYCFSVYQS
jgi:hypothetical protein